MANKKVSESSEELAEPEVRPKGRARVEEEEEELIPEELDEDDEDLHEASTSTSASVSAAPEKPAQPRPAEPVVTPVFDTEQSCTTVGPTVVIRGKIKSDENLVVFGRIEAGIKSTKDVRLESTGIINSDLQVRCVWVAGIVVGDIHATQLVELAPEARVVGDIYTSRLIVKDGAKFRGRVEMDGVQALEALRPPVQAAAPKKTAKSSPAVAEVIWSDVEDLAPTPAHRQAAVTPQAEPAADRAAANARAPAPAQIAVTQRVRQPAAPPPKAPEKPAAPTPAPAPAHAPPQAQGGDKPPAEGEKGIGSWFRRQ